MIWMARAFALMLKLYHMGYQRQFGEERQAVFEQTLIDSSAQGKRALLRMAWQEGKDLPTTIFWAYVHELEARMNISNPDRETRSWLGIAAGLWPFIFLGPVMAIVPYLPRTTSRMLYYDSPVWLAFIILTTLLGLVTGWRKGFPRWSYPYLVILFMVIALPLVILLSQLLGAARFNPVIATIGWLVGLVGLGVGAYFLFRAIPPLRKIAGDIRVDWTRLSFGCFLYLAFATGFYGGDHLQPFSAGIILPALVVTLGALIYLVNRSHWMSILALAVSFLATLGVKIAFQPGEGRVNSMAVFMVILVFSPALLALFPGKQNRVTNK